MNLGASSAIERFARFGYVDTLIEHCGDRLEREAIAVVDGEKFGLWTELIADEDPIEIPF